MKTTLSKEAATLKVCGVLLQSIVRENIDGWGVKARWDNLELSLSELKVETSPPGSLGQFRILSMPTWRGRTLEKVSEVVELLKLSGAAQRFASELEHCVVNLEQSRLATESRREQEPPKQLKVSDYEQWVAEGHPLHPCAKMRWPLTLEDQRFFSPEFGVQFEVPLVAIRQDFVKKTGMGSNSALAEDYPELWQNVQGQIDTEQYEVLPVHPYQYRETLDKLYAPYLEDGRMKKLEGLTIVAKPLMSFRSLEPVGDRLYQLKTAVAVRMTNAVRTVSPQAAENGPELSRVLKTLEQKQSLAPLKILDEVAGAYFSVDDWDLARNLSVLFRESPERMVQPGQVGMPAAALIELGPNSRLVGLDIAEQAGGLQPFWLSYVQALIPPFLRLLSGQGVALEAHLQNCVVVFENGHLKSFGYRDFGGVRFHTDRLKEVGLEVKFHPGSAIVVNDENDLQSKLFYPLFQNHLGELIRALGEHGLDEAWAWSQVRRVCEETFERCDGPFVERDREALFAPFWQMKRLAWMRLHDKVTEYTFSPLLNPLFRSEVERFTEELGEHPELLRIYPSKIREASQIVTGQLGRAMLRENLLDALPDEGAFGEYLLQGFRSEPALDWSTLYREIDNAVANLALILSYRELHSSEQTAWQQIKSAQDSLQTSETLCLAGHNLHPCARTRMGLSVSHLIESAAELKGRPILCLVSIEKEWARWATDRSIQHPNDIAQTLFPDLVLENDRVYLAMHKWQCEQVLPRIYSEELASGVVRIEKHRVEGRATASFRTVILDDQWTVKSSVGSQMTSTTRCISHQTALNGPRITHLLRSLRDRVGGFEILEEPCGVHFASEVEEKTRNLTCVYRRSLNGSLQPGEVAVSGATLTTVLPEILQEYDGSPAQFFAEYIELILPPHLKLFSVYGVALEAHLQNCMVSFKQARPFRLFVRDWGGMRIDLERLRNQGFEVNLAPNSLTQAKSMESARDKLLYCLFRAHLEEIVQAVAFHGAVEASTLWAQLREQIRLVYAEIGPSEDQQYFGSPTWKLKALTRMRLSPQAGYLYVEHPNPLNYRRS